jgi:hypothetical protein
MSQRITPPIFGVLLPLFIPGPDCSIRGSESAGAGVSALILDFIFPDAAVGAAGDGDSAGEAVGSL